MLTTLCNLGGIWDQSLNLSILYCDKLNSKPSQRSEDWSGAIWTESKPKCCHTGKHFQEGAWLKAAEQSLPTDVQAVVMLPEEPDPQIPAGPTAQMSSALKCQLTVPPYRSWTQWSMWIPFPLRIFCVSVIHPPKHHQSLTYFCLQQNLFYSYFSYSLPWFSACFPCHASACTFKAYTAFIDVFL